MNACNMTIKILLIKDNDAERKELGEIIKNADGFSVKAVSNSHDLSVYYSSVYYRGSVISENPMSLSLMMPAFSQIFAGHILANTLRQ